MAKKTWHMTKLTFSSNFYWKICFKFCILEQIIITVLFICISSINNKRSLLRFQSTTAPTNRGWSACAETVKSRVPSLLISMKSLRFSSRLSRAQSCFCTLFAFIAYTGLTTVQTNLKEVKNTEDWRGKV